MTDATEVETLDFETDIESADELDEAPDEAEVLWEKSRRELVVSVLDYNLQTLSDLVTQNQIDLSPRYQRRDRWKADRQSRLIESFLMNVPIPQIFLNEDQYGKYSVIDGKQRLTAIHEFLRGRLRLTGLQIFSELNGKTIDDLAPNFRAIIGTRAALRATIILRQSDNEVKYEVFRRLNTGGVSLNPQEIRNSTWPGPLNNLLLDLSELDKFRVLLGIVQPERSALYKEMRDVELVLRYFTFRNDWDSFSGGMAKRLDRFMTDNQKASKAQLVQMTAEFEHKLSQVHAAFGTHAFRRFTPETKTWRKPIVAALFDAHMFSVGNHPPELLAECSSEIDHRYTALFSDQGFRRSIDAATNTPALFRERIITVRDMITEVIDR
jgi:hypothetical protein